MDRSAGVISAPSSSTIFFRILRHASFVLIGAGGVALLWSAAVTAQTSGSSPGATKPIKTPQQARALGLDSLRRAVRLDKGVPLPTQLDEFVKNRKAAVQLGKALFWDMQVGSDGVMACASCHYHAGADNRTRNQFNPDRLTIPDERVDDVIGYYFGQPLPDVNFETRQPNETVTREDFPLVKSIEEYYRAPDGRVLPGNNNSNDIISSMGTLFTFFEGVRPGSPFDAGALMTDPTWHVGGRNVRRVEPRNAPSVINAVFNLANFWDGRANPHFNGASAFGAQDLAARVYVNRPGQGMVSETIALDNASLASQAMDAPVSFVEMSYGNPAQRNGRTLAEIGVKLLRFSPEGKRLVPLGLQKVHRLDSVLGSLSNAPARGLSTSYEALVKRAFHDRYWNSTQMIPLSTPSVQSFTQMEANFPLFFGLAIALYESTLVADITPFDLWMETGIYNYGFGKKELAGLNLFVNEGKCLDCHAGPELTKASVRHTQGGKTAISAMALGQGTAVYDAGFYNIGVTPTTDDVGRGGNDLNGYPLAYSRQALYERLELLPMRFPIIGNDGLPAKDEDLGSAVCQDANANGICEPSDPIEPAFQRVAVDGAFKTPGLRNVELTGPYFHNGGVATLRQVVQFYNRGGNFCRLNARDLDKSIVPLGLSAEQETQLVAFLTSLTDWRVKHRMAPFDHPELRLAEDGFDTTGTRHIEAVGALGSWQPLQPFLELDPNDAIFTPLGECTPAQ
ncbi:MAG TPA: cytochrome c peroxidase [Steroidobacter sp.]|uniref:cytochrome-c peroxidase n=1 Tax=Steroidobacter sp. TaxID=1978227 RepID=UPI002ED9E8CF